MSSESKIEFKKGGMWEFPGFEIEINRNCSGYGIDSKDACEHCHSFDVNIHTRTDGSTFEEDVWTCPYVLVAYNEGGYNTTGVCLDCIQKAITEVDTLRKRSHE